MHPLTIARVYVPRDFLTARPSDVREVLAPYLIWNVEHRPERGSLVYTISGPGLPAVYNITSDTPTLLINWSTLKVEI